MRSASRFACHLVVALNGRVSRLLYLIHGLQVLLGCVADTCHAAVVFALSLARVSLSIYLSLRSLVMVTLLLL